MALGDSGKRILAALRRLPGSFLFLFYRLVFVHPLFDDTIPGLKVHPTTIHGVGGNKHLKRDLAGTISWIIPGERPQFTAAFLEAFVKLDRKQNTRLWPFVNDGTTRSPPRSFLQR